MTDRLELTAELIRVLREVTTKQIGDHESPVVAPGPNDYPYAVVYCIPGGSYDGPSLGDPTAIADFVYQVTSVGRTAEQVQWMADKVVDAVLGRDEKRHLKHAMNGVADREPESTPGGIEIEGESPNRVYSYAERFLLRIA